MTIGVTGNTGTGKTVICNFFKKWGAHVISCDELGWQILKEPHIVKQVKEKFEEAVDNGRVDRGKLGNIVFRDGNKLKTFSRTFIISLIEEILLLVVKM